MIQANLIDFYCIKLCKIIKTSFFIKGINICYLSDLFINTKDYIRQFNCFWVLDNLQLTIIKDVHNQIATKYPGHQKTISLITRNYYWLGLKKII